MDVRRGRLDDWEGFRAHFESVAAEGRWIGSELPIDWTARRPGFERATAGDGAVVFVADDGGTVVGHAFVQLHAGRGELGMAITDGYRGAGLGRALLEAAVSWAREAGAHKVILEAWPHNERAIALYERVGFVLEGRHRRHWRRNDGSVWDSVSMGLVLDEEAPGSPY